MKKTLFELKNIEYYYKHKKVLDIDNLVLEENQIIGFLGPNGSGKSTLFSLLSFISSVQKGTLSYKGIKSSNLDLKVKQDVVFLPQHPYLLKRTVYENIIYGLNLRGDKQNLQHRVKEALAYVGLDFSFSKRRWNELSGGEAQRVALSSRLVLKPKVLILDEPTSSVDTNSAQIMKEAILHAKQELNTTILVSSHDHNWLNHISNKKVGLFQGRVIYDGSINLLFAPWKKDKNQNLYKIFPDGQKLIFENSKQKKRDSVVMINQNDIRIHKQNESKENILKVSVSSVFKEDNSDEVVVEYVLSGISFYGKMNVKEVQINNILSGKEIYIHIDTKNSYWI